MKIESYGLSAALTVFLVSADIHATPIATLMLQSQPGDFIGQGGTFDEVYPQPGDFYSIVPQVGATVDGLPAYLLFLLGGDQGPTDFFATVTVGTNHLGVPLVPGTYLDAQRAAFATAGHPGLDISFAHRGCNTLTGNFTITDASYTGGQTVNSFAFSFEQHCEGAVPALFGTFIYNANATEVPEPAGYSFLVIGIPGLLWYGRRFIAMNPTDARTARSRSMLHTRSFGHLDPARTA